MYNETILSLVMCIDLYVDKILVYSDCDVPSPSTPSPVPSIVPSIVQSIVPSTVPIHYTPNISSPSPTTIVNGIVNHLDTPSAMPIINTTISPSSSNFSNMTQPLNENSSEFIEHEILTMICIVLATVLPTLFICILIYKKKPKKCKKIPNKVQPEMMKKKKKKCCRCCKEEPQLPEKQTRSTTTGTYMNQPPLPISLPPTPTDK